jgi:hypothetical protein
MASEAGEAIGTLGVTGHLEVDGGNFFGVFAKESARHTP